MQNLRLDDTLQYQFFIDDSIEQDLINIPSMMLQPIIENAIEHGVETVEDPKITISITNQIKYLQCVITDNGIGYSKALKNKKDSKKSFSTKSIKERLLHLSKKTNLNLTYVIKDIKEENGTIIGTKVIIKLPIIEG
jgi:sensor histidine kinase YesM